MNTKQKAEYIAKQLTERGVLLPDTATTCIEIALNDLEIMEPRPLTYERDGLLFCANCGSGMGAVEVDTGEAPPCYLCKHKPDEKDGCWCYCHRAVSAENSLQ